MIKLNDEVIVYDHFPDGTLLLKENVIDNIANIDFLYDNENEVMILYYLVNHLRCKGVKFISLFMPYIPNARMDRCEDDSTVFTLKYFSELINSLNINQIQVVDPHSNVSTALLNNVTVNPIDHLIYLILNDFLHDPTIFYPDKGSVKRYSKQIKRPYVFGNKMRDWQTGKIQKLDIIGDMGLINHKDILIVDDICSKGGTFYYAAKKLKELGANNIYLYVTHCENTVLDGDMINSGLISKIFTTDSIFTKEHPLIEIIERYRDVVMGGRK